MADEAFALSPISARPTPPSDADYEAIRAAFVETSRGRWFLGEYARRNRNADTTMVLEAVARIEQSVAARPQPAAGLAEAIRTIKAFVAEARTDAEDSLVAIERSAELASARKSARVIREIAWSLRECGTDTRICDILDAQVHGIDALHELAGSSRQADAMTDVFERLLIHIDGLAESDSAARPAVAAVPRIEAIVDTTREPIAPSTFVDILPAPPDALPNKTSLADAALADIAYPEDDDVLDLIANEMAAPQDEMFEDDDDLVADAPIVAATESAPQTTAAAPSLQPEPPQPDSLESSLGAALIASGVIRPQSPMASDPLAAIRRLSQAEKIALFS